MIYLCIVWSGDCKPTLYPFLIQYMGCVKITLLWHAYNAVMPLSRAPTRGRYSRIVGVTVVHVRCRKQLKAIRGRYLPFVIKHALFPLGTTSLLVSCSGLWWVCVQTFVKLANFLPHHLGGMTLHQARFHVFLIFFYIFWNNNAMALHACVNVVIPICLKIPSNLLHMELTRTQVHKYDFSNCYG